MIALCFARSRDSNAQQGGKYIMGGSEGGRGGRDGGRGVSTLLPAPRYQSMEQSTPRNSISPLTRELQSPTCE